MTFVFRNATLEPFFSASETRFSGYGDVSFAPEDASKFLWFYVLPPETEPARANETADAFLAALTQALDRVPAGKNFTLVELGVPAGAPVALSDSRLADAVSHYNRGLRETAKNFPNCKIVSAGAEIFRNVDWRFYFAAQIPFSPKQKIVFANATENAPAGENFRVPERRKKCLVLDLDGTLWGGILGEDGCRGVQIGGEYPGNAFLFFQKKIALLAESGIILAIASKNEAADVHEIFEKNPFMALKREDFSVEKIGWSDKATALREIAAELNIGTDACVFVDNDPREREIVSRMLPEVAVPEFPAKPYELPQFFDLLTEKFFRAETLTNEDLNKTAQYRENAERAEFAKKSATFEKYLASLETELKIEPASDWTFPRLAQLSQKTNQFNLTTRRRTENELREMAARGNAIFSLAVKDRFGDSGIVGLAIITPPDARDGIAEIDTFLLSCRVLGRRIEEEFLREIVDRTAAAGAKKICGKFIATTKNAQTADFFPKQKFSPAETSASEKIFYLELGDNSAE